MTSMATSAKRSPAAKIKQSSKVLSATSVPKGKASLRFLYSEPLRKKTLSLLGTLEQAPDPEVHRDALANVVVELTNSGMDYYFIQSLKRAKAGFISEQTANLGMVGVLQVMGPVIRQVIGRMEGPQLLSVCSSIRQFML
jgi:hypothetical protein